MALEPQTRVDLGPEKSREGTKAGEEEGNEQAGGAGPAVWTTW